MSFTKVIFVHFEKSLKCIDCRNISATLDFCMLNGTFECDRVEHKEGRRVEAKWEGGQLLKQ